MNQTIRRALLLAAALAVPAAAQTSPESLAASASSRFEAITFPSASSGFRPTVSADMPRFDQSQTSGISNELRDSSSLLTPNSFRRLTSSPSADLELAPLLNRHLKTALRVQLSGRTVWFSGAFDAAQNPYVSILVDGSAPAYFNVRALLNNEEHMSIGGANYTLSLSPNIFHKMKSTLNLRNDDNSREAARFTVQAMLEAVLSSGETVGLSGQTYKFYYADGVGGQRMFVFIHGDSSDVHVFLVPENQVPADRLGVFTMFGGARVGLAHRGASLQIYDNP